jgi:hypothetical protein
MFPKKFKKDCLIRGLGQIAQKHIARQHPMLSNIRILRIAGAIDRPQMRLAGLPRLDFRASLQGRRGLGAESQAAGQVPVDLEAQPSDKVRAGVQAGQ